MSLRIADIDPTGQIAQELLHAAAAEVRPLYDHFDQGPQPPPENTALGVRERYVAAFVDQLPIGCGALREFDETTAEVRRMYVCAKYRRQGLGRALLSHLIVEARQLGYERIVIETGDKQPAAIALYELSGFTRIEAFGLHVNDPTSRCYELQLGGRPHAHSAV